MKQMQQDFERMVRCVTAGRQELDKLEQLIGLEDFKKAMRRVWSAQKRQIIAFSKGRKLRPASFHMCFLGNPGTGKTEMSRYAAKFFYEVGVVEQDKLLIAGRSDLVSDHVGGTAKKTKALLRRAEGGVLLIDEAYSLMDDRGGSYGDEAINTLVEELDNCRGRLVVILAGYPDRMRAFLASNPGLQSRIPYTVHFSDYSPDELYAIAEKFAEEDGFYFRNDVRQRLDEIFGQAGKDPEFGNARYVRNLIEQAEAVKLENVDIFQLPSLTDEELFQLTPGNFAPMTVVKEYAAERRIGF